MTQAQTVCQLMSAGTDEAVALSAPERSSLSFAGLREHIRYTVDELNTRGVGRGDRVAIVLPNGPEMASSFICIACGAVTAPLNPGYRQEEFEFYLSDLNARALVVAAGDETPARAAAEKLGCEIHYSEDLQDQ